MKTLPNLSGIERAIFLPKAGPGRSWPTGLCLLMAALLTASVGLGLPADWVQMNDDGFFGQQPTGTPTELFVFGPDLYAYDDYGLYRMILDPCLHWEKIYVPVGPGSWSFRPLDGFLYLSSGAGELWMIAQGGDYAADWKQVSCSGPAAGSRIYPQATFGGQLYASVYQPGKDTFDIWRSPDLGKTAAVWTQVVSSGFGDPQNRGLAFMPLFNGKIMAVTTETRTGVFGDPSGFKQGIEVWESATGDPGSWYQVNQDGFGTETSIANPPLTFRTNQDAGSFAVYNGLLYIGTMSHYGAQVWRYDGSGLSGWTEVTPPWAGVCDLGCGPGRDNSLAVFQNYLYLAEGFPTANLARYDGVSWTVEVSGPNPFDPTNGGLSSLAVLGSKLYVSTLHAPYSGQVRGDQVYGYPYSQKPAVCLRREAPDLLYDPPLIRWLVPEQIVQVTWWIRNEGQLSVEEDYLISYYLDGELVHQEPGPHLAPGESAEVSFSREVQAGDHQMTMMVDEEGRVEESSTDNNRYSFRFQAAARDGLPPAGEGGQGPSIAAEAVPVCLSREESHEITARWSTGALQVDALSLVLESPGSRRILDLGAGEGETVLEVSLFQGGTVNLILQAQTPEGVRTASTSVELAPCGGMEMMQTPDLQIVPLRPIVQQMPGVEILPANDVQGYDLRPIFIEG
ncbi:MAG: hypothetical protein GKC10_02780 [Methanosarcinales archaeon]|nr:hypothetical protein [Methanosarcinales archaeon]